MAEEPDPIVVSVSSSPDGDGGDVVEFGRPPRGRRAGPWIAGVAVVVLVALLVVRAYAGHDEAATPPISPSPHVTPASSSGALGLTTAPSTPRLPGVTSGWQIAALGQQTLYRIDPATGAVGTTRVPQLPTTAPPALVYGANWTIVMPSNDATGGYVVADGLPAMPLPETIRGPALPGPDDGHVWIRFTYSDPPQLGLFDPVDAPFPGSVVAPGVVASPGSVSLPHNDGGIWPDGNGGVLTSAGGHLWRGGAPDPVRVHGAVLLAQGAGERVVALCAQAGCGISLDNDVSHRVTAFEAAFPGGASTPGLIAPDRTHAALILAAGSPCWTCASGAAGVSSIPT